MVNELNTVILGGEISTIDCFLKANLPIDVKAEKIKKFCDKYDLLNNNEIYDKISVVQADKLKLFVEKYREYLNTGVYEPKVVVKPKHVKQYKISEEELQVRVKKINEVYEIIHSSMSPYLKADKLLALFPTSESFRKSYTYPIKYGQNDTRFDSCRQAFDEFDYLLEQFKILEKNGIIKYVKAFNSDLIYYQNYKYAKFIIESYIAFSSYKPSKFYYEMGIDKEIFDFCVETVSLLDVDLYKRLIDKKDKNQKIILARNLASIRSIINGIETGYLPDGTEFNTLVFVKKIPFKYSNSFVDTITEFMANFDSSNLPIMLKYINENGYDKNGVFETLNLKVLYNTEYSVNGILITNDIKDGIIGYLNAHGIPVVGKTFNYLRDKYLKGELFFDEYVNRKEREPLTKSKEIPSKVLIP